MSQWSEHNPRLQRVWDSTSLQSFQTCPRYYEYVHIQGWRGSNVHFEFGRVFASATEMYHKLRAGMPGQYEPASKQEAMVAVLRWALEETWDTERNQPWGGTVERLWRCTGEVPYRNSKGNAAKCPYSHKGKWFPAPAPEPCGECGSPVEEKTTYVAEDTAKNRLTLIRLIIWWMDNQPEDLAQGLHAYVFPNGVPAVELSFKLPLPIQTPYGEDYVLSGHIDYIGEFGPDKFIIDNKTTKKGLTASFWSTYSPHMQLDTYDLVGSLLFPDLDLRGFLVDAAQTLVSGAEFALHPYYKTEGHREEHFEDIKYWIKQAEGAAEAGYWPMNKKSCYTCPFKQVCSKAPELREAYLRANFTKGEPWDASADR